MLRAGGVLLGGYDTGINYIFDEDEERVAHSLPYNPLRDPELYEQSMRGGWGIQFSHTAAEQLSAQLTSGFTITHLYDDTNGVGNLHEHNIPTFLAVRAVKPE